MSERWHELPSISSVRIVVGMPFGQTELFGFKLEIMLEILFLSVWDEKNNLKYLFPMYSKKCLFSAAVAKWLLKIFAISTGFMPIKLLRFKVLENNGGNIF